MLMDADARVQNRACLLCMIGEKSARVLDWW